MVQGLRLWASTAGAWVQPLSRQLRSHMPWGMAQNRCAWSHREATGKVTQQTVFLLLHILSLYFLKFIYLNWRLITLQYCGDFCHTLTWISHGFTCVPHSDRPSHLPPHPIPQVFPVHQPRALVSCIQPGLAICFTLNNILVSMLFSQSFPPSPSPAESKSLFYTSVFLLLFHI